MSGDDAGGRDTFAAVGATVCEFCRNPALAVLLLLLSYYYSSMESNEKSK
jgi:hypothetical protein